METSQRTMIKLRPLIQEYVTNPISDLAKYLRQSDIQKGEELAFAFPEYIYQFLGKGETDDEEAHDVVDRLYTKDKPKFDEYAKYVFKLFGNGTIEHDQYMRPGFPSWNYMEFQKIVKNQWLIHFSNDAREVWWHGFKYGVEDLSTLGLTTYIKNTSFEKKNGGYNFAYDISDYKRHGRERYHRGGWKYGNEAVLFRASGVKVWHFGDEEPQVIFVGSTARDIVYLRQTDPGPWGVVNTRNDNTIFYGELEDVVDWVMANYEQYRKVLSA